MVFGEPLLVVLEGVEGGGGDDAGLAHAAAEGLAGAAGLVDGLLGSGEQGAHGGAEALGGADGDGVRVLAPLAGRDAGRGLGVEEPGAVEVDLEAALPRHVGGGGEVFERVDLAAGGVVGVLQAEQARAREVDVLGPDGGADGLGVEDAAVAGEGAELDAGEQGRGAALVDEDVGALVDQDLLGPAVLTWTPIWLVIVPDGA